jgi:hypothetical protein
VKELVGKEESFIIKLEGDRWFLSGALSNGTKIEENWKRME